VIRKYLAKSLKLAAGFLVYGYRHMARDRATAVAFS
jgi:hypothetical protein